MEYPVDSRLLYVFCRVVELKNMTSAAKSLFLTSSAVSHNLRKLESELGTSLLDRNPRNLSTTPAGRKLYNLSRPVLADLKKIRSEINDFELLKSNVIRIGTNSALNLYGFPKTLIALRKHYPEIIVQVVCHSQAILENMFASKEIDLLLLPTLTEYHDSDRKKKILGYDEINLFFKNDKNWGIKDAKNYNLAHNTIILEEALKKDFSKDIRKDLPYPLNKMKNYLFLNGEESIKRYVQTGVGIGMLPDWMVKKEVEDGQLGSITVESLPLKRYWYYQFLDQKDVDPIIQNLKAQLHNLLGFQLS